MSAAALTTGPAFAALREAQQGMSLRQMQNFLSHLAGWVASAIDQHGLLSADCFRRGLDASRKHAMEPHS